MEGSLCESDSWFSSPRLVDEIPDSENFENRSGRKGLLPEKVNNNGLRKNKKTKSEKKKHPILLEGYVETTDDENLPRTKSLTDEDLAELKGCLDLGFGFSYDEIPELCNTLPALELCYSMTHKYMDEHQKSPEASSTLSSSPVDSCSSSIANWRISGPGDHPEDVKARLRFWAQAVAFTVKLCS